MPSFDSMKVADYDFPSPDWIGSDQMFTTIINAVCHHS
jgi:hypothetical protein